MVQVEIVGTIQQQHNIIFAFIGPFEEGLRTETSIESFQVGIGLSCAEVLVVIPFIFPELVQVSHVNAGLLISKFVLKEKAFQVILCCTCSVGTHGKVHDDAH